jgi:hypothetical protein
MKKVLLTMIGLFVLVFALSGISYGWQGRMGGMEDPYGLVQDESDFLIHPAKIAKGEGVKFYGDYRFTFTDVPKWDNELHIFNSAGTLFYIYPKETSGQEYRHEALLGSSFPLGPGRMGVFFQYSGRRGDYDGKETELDTPASFFHHEYDLRSDFDNFSFRLLYGLPVGSFKAGGEVQVSYRQEENRLLFNQDGLTMRVFILNDYLDGLISPECLFPFMLPYDSRYWEALFKGSLEGKVGPLDLELTLRAGFPFGGENKYEYDRQSSSFAFRLDGDVTGWRIGGDLWARYLLANDFSLPFLVRIDYQEKTRDGDGPGLFGLAGDNFSYKNKEQSLHLTLGGGLDKELAKGAKIAAGIYYNYLQGSNDFDVRQSGVPPRIDDYSDFPDSTEHQVMLRLAGELALSPIINLRMGLAPFYGWVREDFKFTRSFLTSDTDDVPTDGFHWGIAASVGGTIKFKAITLEPFMNFGYQQLHLKGDGSKIGSVGNLSFLYDMSKDRDEWSIGGGLSVLYDL